MKIIQISEKCSEQSRGYGVKNSLFLLLFIKKSSCLGAFRGSFVSQIIEISQKKPFESNFDSY